MINVLQTYQIKKKIRVESAVKWVESSPSLSLISAASSSSPSSSSAPITPSSFLVPLPVPIPRSAYRIGRPHSIVVTRTFWQQQEEQHRRQQQQQQQPYRLAISNRAVGDELDGNENESPFARLISDYLSMLPRSIRSMEFERNMRWYERSQPFPLQLSAFHLSDSITSLSLNECVIRPASGSASSCLDLSEWRLPNSLTTLHFGDHSWQASLSSLQLPHSLTDLHLATWEGKVDQLPTLPPNLQTLHMGKLFNDPIDSIQWPSSPTVPHTQ